MQKRKNQSEFEIRPMELALELAHEGAHNMEVPVGAVIIDADKKILARAHNQVEKQNDPTCHAEMLVIRDATRILKSKSLSGCSIYVTLEPCAMCSSAISYARISRLYYGASDEKFGSIENGVRIFQSDSSLFVPEIYGGILISESTKLIKDFFLKKRF